MLDNIIAALVLSICIIATQHFVAAAWMRYRSAGLTVDRHLSELNAARLRRNCTNLASLTHSEIRVCRVNVERAAFILNRD